MAPYRHSGEKLHERRGIIGAVFNTIDRSKHGLRGIHRGTRFGRVTSQRFLYWVFSVAAFFSIYLAIFGINMPYHAGISSQSGQEEFLGRHVMQQPIMKRHRAPGISSQSGQEEFLGVDAMKQPIMKRHRPRFIPCKVGLLDTVDDLVEPTHTSNFTQFSIGYIEREEIFSENNPFEPRFGGHQTLEEREASFYARNQTVHCGFIKGPEGYPSTGFDLNDSDKTYMNTCKFVVSSCIFGSSDFLRRPSRKLISGYSQKNVCFVMFVDEQSLLKLSLEGNVPDEKGYIGLWRIVTIKNLPYKDMRKDGKVPKFLSHRLFPSSRYSIWIDSKLRLLTDPMLMIDYFLWRAGSEYAISNHYTRHCVWEEVLQNKRLHKYNLTAIDQQFLFYQSDGLTMFDPSDPNLPLPSYVPEGSFIVRAHTPMSNLFSCLWFNEVDRFTSRDQLSFGYTFLKLKKMNPDRPFYLNMFKDCERRAMAKLFRHRAVSPPFAP